MNTLALVRSLTRSPDPRCLVEGLRRVRAADEAGARIDLLVVAEDAAGDAIRAFVERQRRRGVPVRRAGARTLGTLSGRDSRTEIVAVVRARPRRLDDLRVRRVDVLVCAEGLGYAGNLGAIARTADAAGCAGLIVSGGGADPYGAEAVRASMGAMFALPVARAVSLGDACAWARRNRVQVVTTSVRAPVSLWEARIRRPCMVVVGPERTGLTVEQLAGGDVAVRIPIRGSVSSLNVAVAAGVVLFALRRR